MKSFQAYTKIAWIAGSLLILPTVYFFFINLMNEFGWYWAYNVSEPMLNSLGLNQSLGLNINLLVLFGPVLALMLNVLSVLHIRIEAMKDRIDCRLSINKSWKNLAVVVLSTLVLLALFAYALGENCNCH